MKKDSEKDLPKDGATAHKQEPGPLDVGGGSNPDGSLPMGMLGTTDGGEGDPDQKSTHNAPKTVESTLPDGSPKYADPGSVKATKRTAKAGRYEAVNRITALVGDALKTIEPGDTVELDAKEAESLGDNIKPV